MCVMRCGWVDLLHGHTAMHATATGRACMPHLQCPDPSREPLDETPQARVVLVGVRGGRCAEAEEVDMVVVRGQGLFRVRCGGSVMHRLRMDMPQHNSASASLGSPCSWTLAPGNPGG